MNSQYKILTAFILYSSVLLAQQQSLFTTYRYNMNLVNPAYAGLDSKTVFSSTFRNQWTGIKEAPQTQAFSFGTSVAKSLGIGLSMIYDKTFIEKQTVVGIDISYKIQAGSMTDLYFGIKAGGNAYNLNTAGLETYNIQPDPALYGVSKFNPNIGLGVVLNSQKYYVSLSVPALFNTQRAKKNDNEYAAVASDRPHLYLSAGYEFDFNSPTSLVLKPSLMTRYVSGAPLSLDINTMLQIDEFLEIGGTYRIDKAFAGIAGLTISKLLTIGYAYEVSTRREMASAGNTNEFFLRFKI